MNNNNNDNSLFIFIYKNIYTCLNKSTFLNYSIKNK